MTKTITDKNLLPKTGQTNDYGYSHDDGEYQTGWPKHGTDATPRFLDNGNNTTDDRATNIQWIKDHAAVGTVGGYNFANSMTWDDAILAVNALNAAAYAGHSDWKLPNVKELMSIVDYGSVSPAINGTFFPNTVSDGYWSGTLYAGSPDNFAWVVYFNDGSVNGYYRDYGYYVRPCRQY